MDAEDSQNLKSESGDLKKIDFFMVRSSEEICQENCGKKIETS